MKIKTPTPCCQAKIVLKDGLRLLKCPACDKVWQTYTARGKTSFIGEYNGN